MNDDKIVLQTIIDTDGIKPKDIAKIQKILDKYPLKLNTDLDKEAENIGSSFANKLKTVLEKLNGDSIVSNLFAPLFAKAKEALAELKEIDAYVTAIRNTNHNLSKSDLARLAADSLDIAAKYGKKATNYLSAVQDMTFAGYENAASMAELSVAVQTACDMTDELANKYIITADEAYHLNGSVQALTKVLDGGNHIASRNTLDMAELAEGISIVGKQASDAGIEINEVTAALAAMIAVTQLSGSEAALAFKGIIMSLRQIADKEEGIDAECLQKYEEACAALGVSLKQTKDGLTSLRDPMKILEDLSEAYMQFDANSMERTNLLSSVGGQGSNQALDALLSNWDIYSKMLHEYSEGAGSITQKAETAASSWEGSTNRLSTSWTQFMDSLTNQDTIIGATDALSGLLDGISAVTNSVGILIPLLGGAGIFAGFKNVGEGKMQTF